MPSSHLIILDELMKSSRMENMPSRAPVMRRITAINADYWSTIGELGAGVFSPPTRTIQM